MQHTRPTHTSAASLRRATRTDRERAIVMPRRSLDSEIAGDMELEILRLCDERFSAIVIDLRALAFTEPAADRLLRRLGAVTGRHQVTLSVSDSLTAAAWIRPHGVSPSPSPSERRSDRASAFG